jgi:small subunit ribosomal protein S20
MANHASAEKRNRQRIVRTERNRGIRQSVRTAVKKARAALAGGDEQLAKERITDAVRALAKAASKGVVHKKAASRTASRMQLAFQRRGSAG